MSGEESPRNAPHDEGPSSAGAIAKPLLQLLDGDERYDGWASLALLLLREQMWRPRGPLVEERSPSGALYREGPSSAGAAIESPLLHDGDGIMDDAWAPQARALQEEHAQRSRGPLIGENSPIGALYRKGPSSAGVTAVEPPLLLLDGDGDGDDD